MKRILAFLLVAVMALSCSGCISKVVGLISGYYVVFDPNGGSIVSGEGRANVRPGESAEAPEVERLGYEFAGWDGDITNVQENKTVKAIWKQLFNYSFDTAGGVASGQTSGRLAEGKTPVAPSVEREGWTFKGWDPAVGPLSSDTRYVATWERIVYSSTEVSERVLPAVIEITVADSRGDEFALGSGFFIDEGIAVTNYHVMEGAYSATAAMSGGTEHDVLGIIDYSEELDLAIIKVDVTENPVLVLSEDGVETGQTVYAIGSSLGLTGTFSNGIVSTASREVDGIDCIQVTAPISQGNSGGPLVNEYCEVVGVNSMTASEGQNLNFAINIQELKKLSRDGFTSMEDFGYATNPEPGFYGVYAYSEYEPNNSKGYADTLYNNQARAAELSSASDEDYYKISVSGSCTLKIYFQFFDSDNDNAAFRFGYYSGSTFKSVDIDFDYNASGDYYEATIRLYSSGDYYLVIVAPSNPYSYTYPIYYAVEAEVRY